MVAFGCFPLLILFFSEIHLLDHTLPRNNNRFHRNVFLLALANHRIDRLVDLVIDRFSNFLEMLLDAIRLRCLSLYFMSFVAAFVSHDVYGTQNYLQRKGKSQDHHDGIGEPKSGCIGACKLEQNKSHHNVPKNKLANMDILYLFPILLQLAGFALSAVIETFCPPTHVINAAQCVHIEDVEVGRAVKDEGKCAENYVYHVVHPAEKQNRDDDWYSVETHNANNNITKRFDHLRPSSNTLNKRRIIRRQKRIPIDKPGNDILSEYHHHNQRKYTIKSGSPINKRLELLIIIFEVHTVKN